MAREKCKNGIFKPGDTLPEGCPFYMKKPFKPLDVCPRCLLYKPAVRSRRGPAARSM